MTAGAEVRASRIHGDKAAAEYIGAGVDLIKRARRQRRIPFAKYGHRSVSYSLADLDAFIRRHTVPALGVRQ